MKLFAEFPSDKFIGLFKMHNLHRKYKAKEKYGLKWFCNE